MIKAAILSNNIIIIKFDYPIDCGKNTQENAEIYIIVLILLEIQKQGEVEENRVLLIGEAQDDLHYFKCALYWALMIGTCQVPCHGGENSGCHLVLLSLQEPFRQVLQEHFCHQLTVFGIL